MFIADDTFSQAVYGTANCSAQVASGNLTIQATDTSTGRVTTTTIPEGFVCGTEPVAGSGSGNCPLPPD
jgi:hypothetical protein